MNPRPVFRFAPSPNGELHLGHVLSAWAGHEMARRFGGRFLLRIEDIDPQRSREDFVAQIFSDLSWLGFSWEEPVLRQSERFAAYAGAADILRRAGLLYPCWASRRDIETAAAAKGLGCDPDGAPLYPGLCKGLSAAEVADRLASGTPYCWRLDMDRALAEVQVRLAGQPLAFLELDAVGRPLPVTANPERWGDAVIVRKETPTSYHLSVVIDDAAQGVTHVTRGMDLFTATDVQRVLQVLLGLPEPVYHHHPLVLDADGRKLAKSNQSTSLRSLREAGASPADVLRLAGVAELPLPHNC